MQLLLDTHILLWWLENSEILTNKTKKLISDIDNIVYVSSASVWEISIKQALGKLKLAIAIEITDAIIQCGFEELKIDHKHAKFAGTLPLIHNDPFDRMLIAQSQQEGLALITHDKVLKKYKTNIILNNYVN